MPCVNQQFKESHFPNQLHALHVSLKQLNFGELALHLIWYKLCTFQITMIVFFSICEKFFKIQGSILMMLMCRFACYSQCFMINLI